MDILLILGVGFIIALCTRPALTILVFLPLMLIAFLLFIMTGAFIIF